MFDNLTVLDVANLKTWLQLCHLQIGYYPLHPIRYVEILIRSQTSLVIYLLIHQSYNIIVLDMESGIEFIKQINLEK